MRYLLKKLGRQAFLDFAVWVGGKRLHDKAVSELCEDLGVREFREYTGCPKRFYIELHNRLLAQARLN